MSLINIRTFTGASLKTYATSMAKLRTEICKERPFLCKATVEEETTYLRKLSEQKDAIAVLVFDGSIIVGASIGAPFESQDPEFLKIFQEKGLNPHQFYYFGQSVLSDPYRGRGLGHHFFDIREQHVKHLKRFKSIWFLSIMPSHKHDIDPTSEISSLFSFWEKRGYIKHPDLIIHKSGNKESSKTLMFWTKDI